MEPRVCSICKLSKKTTWFNQEIQAVVCSGCYNSVINVEHCVLCGEENGVAIRLANEEPVCLRCYAKGFYRARREPCSECERSGLVMMRKKDGGAVCPACYQKKYAPKEPCTICTRLRTIYGRIGKAPICRTCWRRDFSPKEKCCQCGKLRGVVCRVDDKPYCGTCHQKYVNVEKCGRCGQERTIAVRQKNGQALCRACWGTQRYLDKSKREVCIGCNKSKVVNNRTDDRRPICRECSKIEPWCSLKRTARRTRHEAQRMGALMKLREDARTARLPAA